MSFSEHLNSLAAVNKLERVPIFQRDLLRPALDGKDNWLKLLRTAGTHVSDLCPFHSCKVGLWFSCLPLHAALPRGVHLYHLFWGSRSSVAFPLLLLS